MRRVVLQVNIRGLRYDQKFPKSLITSVCSSYRRALQKLRTLLSAVDAAVFQHRVHGCFNCWRLTCMTKARTER